MGGSNPDPQQDLESEAERRLGEHEAMVQRLTTEVSRFDEIKRIQDSLSALKNLKAKVDQMQRIMCLARETGSQRALPIPRPFSEWFNYLPIKFRRMKTGLFVDTPKFDAFHNEAKMELYVAKAGLLSAIDEQKFLAHEYISTLSNMTDEGKTMAHFVAELKWIYKQT